MRDIKPLKDHVNEVVQYSVREISEIYKKPHAVELEFLNLYKRGCEVNQDPDEIILYLLVEKVLGELYCNIPDIVFSTRISTRYGSHRMVISCRELEMCYIVASKCVTTLDVPFVGGSRKTKTNVNMGVFTLDILRAGLITEGLRLDVPKAKD